MQSSVDALQEHGHCGPLGFQGPGQSVSSCHPTSGRPSARAQHPLLFAWQGHRCLKGTGLAEELFELVSHLWASEET